jgi:hypothetical protein
MSRETYCEGTATYSSNGKTTIHAFDGDVTFTAATKNRWNGKESGITEHIYKAPEKKKEQPKKAAKESVKEIERLTPLDQGSKNDLSGKFQDGMIFGKAYHFKVKSYAKETPKDKSVIKWMLKYHSPSENKWIEIPLASKGDSVKITMNEEDMCGRNAYIRAYINDSETEGELTVWKHNRFRWFDRKKVFEQIEERVKEPWRIKQGSSSLCGMAALYYAMLKRDANAYKKLAKELFRTGEYTISSYILKPHEKALSMYETKPNDSNYVAMQMFEIDWIVMATTRSKESLNNHFVYNGFESGKTDMLKAVNWPDMLTRMCKEVAGFGNAVSHNLGFNAINNKKRLLSARIYDYFSNSDLEELQEIDKNYKWGRTILMMIDADMIEDKSGYGSLADIGNDSHWVVYEGGLQFFDVKGNNTTVLKEVVSLSFRIFTWGRSPITANFKSFVTKSDITDSKVLNLITPTPKTGIKVESFKSNYYGYIEVG